MVGWVLYWRADNVRRPNIEVELQLLHNWSSLSTEDGLSKIVRTHWRDDPIAEAAGGIEIDCARHGRCRKRSLSVDEICRQSWLRRYCRWYDTRTVERGKTPLMRRVRDNSVHEFAQS